jgi:hypothetical protein
MLFQIKKYFKLILKISLDKPQILIIVGSPESKAKITSFHYE